MDVAADGKRWFFVREGRRQGPLERRELLESLLAEDVPELVLVWHAGLPAWVKAGKLDELRHELPPPIPQGDAGAREPGEDLLELQVPPLPQEEESAGPGLAAAGAAAPGAADALPGGPSYDDGLPEGQPATEPAKGAGRHRRRRHHRRGNEARLGSYFGPLLLILLMLALVLWLLLRRLNEVPPGRIIFQGALERVTGLEALTRA